MEGNASGNINIKNSYNQGEKEFNEYFKFNENQIISLKDGNILSKITINNLILKGQGDNFSQENNIKSIAKKYQVLCEYTSLFAEIENTNESKGGKMQQINIKYNNDNNSYYNNNINNNIYHYSSYTGGLFGNNIKRGHRRQRQHRQYEGRIILSNNKNQKSFKENKSIFQDYSINNIQNGNIPDYDKDYDGNFYNNNSQNSFGLFGKNNNYDNQNSLFGNNNISIKSFSHLSRAGSEDEGIPKINQDSYVALLKDNKCRHSIYENSTL